MSKTGLQALPKVRLACLIALWIAPAILLALVVCGPQQAQPWLKRCNRDARINIFLLSWISMTLHHRQKLIADAEVPIAEFHDAEKAWLRTNAVLGGFQTRRQAFDMKETPR